MRISASLASSSVEWNASTRLCGSLWINPTVSESRKVWWFSGSILRTVVSSVAKSMSFSITFFSSTFTSLLPYKSSIAFISVDFPAFVYPTNATRGIPAPTRRLRCVIRSALTSFNSLLSSVRRRSNTRLSNSSFFSPAPLLLKDPLPPPCLLKAAWSPTSRGSIYCSLATSTWSFASLDLALLAKISRINVLLSKIGFSKRSWRFLSCIGERELSNIMTSASHSAASSFTSSTLPVPI